MHQSAEHPVDQRTRGPLSGILVDPTAFPRRNSQRLLDTGDVESHWFVSSANRAAQPRSHGSSPQGMAALWKGQGHRQSQSVVDLRSALHSTALADTTIPASWGLPSGGCHTKATRSVQQHCHVCPALGQSCPIFEAQRLETCRNQRFIRHTVSHTASHPVSHKASHRVSHKYIF